ncbi:MAG: DUF4340 domain-containing protein [Planctomycetes bacterium]|nr:DUF4340 domain-containing protein [Planctomycetota bacterium]
MNFRTPVILLLLVLIGGLVWFLLPASQPADDNRVAEIPARNEPRYVLDPRPEETDVVRLEVEGADGARLVFERTPKAQDPAQLDDWQMRAPLESPTESYMVTNLLNTFLRLQSRSQLEPGAANTVSLAEAGLEPPVATVRLVDQEAREYQLEVGKKAAMSSDTYVRVAGQDVIHIGSRDLGREVKKEVNEYRAKSLARLSASDAVHVRIEHEGQSYDLTKSADGEWVINSPVKAYAESKQVESLIGRFNSARVVEFCADAPDTLAPYGLDEPFMTATVTTEIKREIPAAEPSAEGADATTQPSEPQYETITRTYALAVGSYADMQSKNRYVKLLDQPWVATMAKANAEAFVPNLAELRDARITRVATAAATQLELTAGGISATLTKEDNVWRGTGDLEALETAAVVDLLEAFEDVRAIDYVDAASDLATFGLDEPRAVIRVTAAGAVAPVTLRVGSNTASGRNAYVQVEGQPTVMVISAKQGNRLAVTPLSLRSRTIFDCQPAHIGTLYASRGEIHAALEMRDNFWRFTDPAGAPPDRAGVRELVNDLARLRAKRVVAKGAEAWETYGLANPLVTIRFTISAPVSPPTTQTSQPLPEPTAEPHVLYVGRGDGAAYCRKDDDPYIFELDETVYKVLTGELIRRQLFDFKPADIVRVTVVTPDGQNDLVRDGEVWKYAPDPYLKLSAKKVEEFIKNLAELRVELYQAYQDGDLALAGLLDAPVTVTIGLKDAREVVLKIAQRRPGELPRQAAWVAEQRIFLLRQADAENLLNAVDYYVEPETPAGEGER